MVPLIRKRPGVSEGTESVEATEVMVTVTVCEPFAGLAGTLELSL
jgi:hypothetical protein